jgi:hypothetical protein
MFGASLTIDTAYFGDIPLTNYDNYDAFLAKISQDPCADFLQNASAGPDKTIARGETTTLTASAVNHTSGSTGSVTPLLSTSLLSTLHLIVVTFGKVIASNKIP